MRNQAIEIDVTLLKLRGKLLEQLYIDLFFSTHTFIDLLSSSMLLITTHTFYQRNGAVSEWGLGMGCFALLTIALITITSIG